MQNWSSKTGKYLKSAKERVRWQGSLDYDMRKAILYMENYLKVMEKYEGYENYDKLIQKMSSIKNPIIFYETIQNQELIADLTLQSDKVYNQLQFNRFVENWGIEGLEDVGFNEIIE